VLTKQIRGNGLLFLLLLLLLPLLFRFWVPFAVAVEPAGNIRRTAHMDVRRFLPRQDVVSKNPAGGTDPDRKAGGARRLGVLSFGYFSLHKQRKVTRSKSESF